MVVLGLPIVLNAFGDAAILPMFLLISVHSALIFSLVTLFAELDGAGSRLRELGATLRGIVTNPILLGLMAGLVFNLLGITLPGPLEDTVALLGDSALPTALFAVGATLSQYRLSGHYTEALVLVVLKIIAQPLLVWLLAFHVFQIDPIWGAVAVVAAGMPTGINSYLFAQRYGVAIEPMASAIVLSTLLTVGTVPFIISQFL
ncbi:MAG: AEC family transporter, partial [Chloroflexota bacterium]